MLREVAPGVTADEVVAATGAPLTVADDVPDDAAARDGLTVVATNDRRARLPTAAGPF